MKSTIFVSLFAILFLAQACTNPQPRTPRSVGGTSEILAVTQNTEQWDGAPGEAIRSFFGREQYGLPQAEAQYRIANILVANLSDMFKKHRNMLIVEIDPKLKEAVVESRSDLWAKPQKVIKITAPSAEAWVEAFEAQKEAFAALYNKSERERLMNLYRPSADYKIISEIEKTLDIKLLVPEGFFVAKNEGNFMWLRKEVAEYSQGLILYVRPYRDTADLSPSRLIKVRDSLLQKYIPGPVDKSFMSTDKEFMLPISTATNQYVTDFAMETRGVWNVVGDFMAGPFLAYTVVDERHGRLITLEGYVYAPSKPKRDYLRQLEAILYTLELPEQAAQ
jgi:hypothetical protein